MPAFRLVGSVPAALHALPAFEFGDIQNTEGIFWKRKLWVSVLYSQP